MATSITYKGAQIASLTTGTKTLKTAGKYMEDDVTVSATGSGGEAISIVDEFDSHGGIIRHINGVLLGNDTVSSSVLLSGYTAHDSEGNAITGSYVAPTPAVLGTKTITANGIYSASSDSLDGYSKVTVSVSSGVNLQSKSANPTESVQNIDPDPGYALSRVTIGAISNTYVGTSVTRRSSNDLTVSGSTITAPSGYYSAAASKSISAGTAGTPSATKGTVSNHSISITPAVTNTAGYITSGTKTGTPVIVSASELVSGSETKTANGTYDVTNLASLIVNVSSGGSTGTQIGTASTTVTDPSLLTFTGLLGEPTSFIVLIDATTTPGNGGLVTLTWDGRMGSNFPYIMRQGLSSSGITFSESDGGIYPTYSQGTFEISSTVGNFYNAQYTLIYSYGGTNYNTKQVQVGSGATSITFTGLEDEPTAWYLTFRSDFSTSSGYQRVIAVANDGQDISGLSLDSSAHPLTSWTASYNNGSLTVTSTGTNNGGYFHQPGYYQLTYIIADGGGGGSYQAKSVTYTPTTSTQTDVIEPDNDYDALSKVNITVNPIPSQYIIPTGNKSITSNGTNIDVASYATVTVSVSGSGGGLATLASLASSAIANSAYTATNIKVTIEVAGTYTLAWEGARTSTSGTSGSRIYRTRNGTTSSIGTAVTTFNMGSYAQHNELTNQSFQVGDVLTIYARSRASNYSMYVSNLVAKQTA